MRNVEIRSPIHQRAYTIDTGDLLAHAAFRHESPAEASAIANQVADCADLAGGFSEYKETQQNIDSASVIVKIP